ncbi:hypothetical protein QA597_08925 [Marinilabiliaceae bacterium ANBcel2]|nr:hypothetical protein [Marinilabiliaceae bacterium ANBcel2]
MRYSFINRGCLFFFILIITSCSTQKNTWWSRNYHSITARYNALFNGEQSFKRGEQTLIDANIDDFTTILHLFPYEGREKAQLVESNMARAIEKAEKIIRNKSITAPPENPPSPGTVRYESFKDRREFNRAVDEAYILLGKAHLYNHDYYNALAVFNRTIREFPAQSARFKALIWMARTYIEMGDYNNARISLDRYRSEGTAPTSFRGKYASTYGSYLIHTNNYNDAIEYIKIASENAPGKWHRVRRKYILGQLYEGTGNHVKAKESFRSVFRSNPNYEMALNARIRQTINRGIANSSDAENTVKELEEMAAHPNNREYRDYIYNAIAQVWIEKGEKERAITNLKLSAGYNEINNSLLAETYIQLGELTFEESSYSESYSYYNSSLNLILPDDPRRETIESRHNGLERLSTEFDTIVREDSLQTLALMSEEDLNIFIDNLQEEMRHAQMQSTEEEDIGRRLSAAPAQRRGAGQNLFGREEAQWYFYNNSAVSLGKMEFERRWGNRTLSDNWRRADDSSTEYRTEEITQPGMPGLPAEDAQSIPGDSDNGEIALPTREELLADIPLTPEKLDISHNKLAQSLFNAGIILYNHFKDYSSAAEMLTNLSTQYPNHHLAEEALFWAYKACQEIDNIERMEQIKSELQNSFPAGRYTAFITDPETVEAEREMAKSMNELYKEAYNDFRSNRLNEAINKSSTIKAEARDSSLIRKASLLTAVITGAEGDTTAFRSHLQEIELHFPNTEEAETANRWLALLKEGKVPASSLALTEREPTTTGELTEKAEEEDRLKEIYIFNPEEEHFVFVISTDETDINRLQFNIAEYNFSRYTMSDFDIENLKLPQGENITITGPFKNSDEAMDYFYSLRSRPLTFNVDNIDTPQLMAASEKNLNTLKERDTHSDYREFFTEHYLRGRGGTEIMIPEEQVAAEEDDEINYKVADKDKEHLAMILVTERADINRVAGFLTGHALNEFNINVSSYDISLENGETVVVVEKFPDKTTAQKFTESLGNVNFWNTRLGGASWQRTVITEDNLELIKKEGSTKSYFEFIKE